ncbi:PREDICTED: uncharacterized protein LOC105460431, partial [Wasmannia auropunctata]|uniref:uncharacterized protein LOC105460431 n=1 Tax=Wasmannia auropunctata TaxID=64793 RepID=UPI0005EFAC23
MADLWSQNGVYKIYTPSILIIFVFSCFDLICCIKWKLPCELERTTILKDVFTLLKSKSVVIFFCFTTIFGVLNSIMRTFLFWYIEDLAIATDYMGQIKLIEGLIVAAQTLCEVIFWFLS